MVKNSPCWYWFDKDRYISGDNNGWVKLSNTDNDAIENEYKQQLNPSRIGQLVYHCFGDGLTALVNFNSMETYCGSGRCRYHTPGNLEMDHMVYKLKRDPQ